MNINWGMLAAVGMFILTALSLVVRELRYRATDVRRQTIDDADMKSIVDGIKLQIDMMFKQIKDLDLQRQAHDLECAKIKERLSVNLDHVTDTQRGILDMIENINRQLGELAKINLGFRQGKTVPTLKRGVKP